MPKTSTKPIETPAERDAEAAEGRRAVGSSRPITSVGIVARHGTREAIRTAAELADWLRRRDVEVSLDEAILRARHLDQFEAFDLEDAYAVWS